MADWTGSAMTSCQDRADAGWSDDEMVACADRADASWANDELTPCHDRVGLFAFGMDEDDHADTGTRATSAGWSTTPLSSCED